jgi:hypothetical protein
VQNSTNTAEGRTDTGEAPDAKSDPLSDVVDILKNTEVDETDNQDDADDDGARAPKKVDVPKTLDAIAEGLGVDVADLYEIEIPLGSDQEPLTLGALKDLGKAGSQIDLDRIEFEETKTQFETQQRKTAQDFADLVASLPKDAVTNELVDKIHRQRAAIQEREEQLIAATIPTWSDPVVRERDQKVMAAYLDDFGFPQGFLETVVDHKTTAVIRDAALRKQRLENALEQVRQVRNTGHGATTNPSKPKPGRKASGQKPRRVQTEINEVANLISSALKG